MSISIQTIPVGPIEENCYVVTDEQTKEGIVIDAGDDGDKILSYIRNNNIDVKLLVNTHGHWDHIGAVDFLRDALNCQLAIHSEDQHMLSEDPKNWGTYLKGRSAQRPAEILLADGDCINFGKSSLRVIHTPGHTRGGICLYGEGALFSGDTLFAGDVGRTDLPGGSYSEIICSVRERLLPVADLTKVYPGHGPSSNMGYERAHNSYIACN